MIKGTITKGIGGFYYIDTPDGVYECRARGKFRKEKITPLVGDSVGISILDEKNKKGSLDEIYPRKNELIRPRVANVTQAVIVFAAKSPNLNLELLDRFIVLVEEQELDVVICINKVDLISKDAFEKIAEIYKPAGYPVIPVSAESGENIHVLKDALAEKISVFAGPSGVGKSSLINRVNPELNLATGQISEKIERGKHTTRHAELIEIFDDSFIVDSPGFTSLMLNHIQPEDLRRYFIEFEQFESLCRFKGCNHVDEPDCEVKKQVGGGIHEKRYKRYVSLYGEILNERKKNY